MAMRIQKEKKMMEEKMLQGARKMVVECTNVQKGEHVLILTDRAMPFSIAEVLAKASQEREAEPVVMLMNPVKYAGNEPPPTVAAAMEKADVIFMALSQGVFHSQTRIRATQAGARGMTIANFMEEDMMYGAIEANFQETRVLGEKIGEALRKAKEARISTQLGTDLYMDLRQRGDGVKLFTNICQKPGEFGIMILEIATSPNVGTAQGVVVGDGTITFYKPGLIPKEPVRAVVKDGVVTEITGGDDARRLAEALAALKDPLVYNVAELGIGYNPKAKIVGRSQQDKGVYGTCHIGFGSNITWGGKVKAATHFDLLLYAPKIELDGTTILENYQFHL
jgi:2,5-dihydroxypyridine 5,6-dioxygenase